MPLIPLKIPAGVVKNGTVFQQANSWNDANLVRWHEGTMQPVGGWRARTTSQMNGVCRALITYVDNSSNRRTVAGTNTKLYVINEAGSDRYNPCRFHHWKREWHAEFRVGWSDLWQLRLWRTKARYWFLWPL